MSKWFIAGALGLSLIADSLAQRPAPSADAMRSIEFVTDEGTWISLDVAPDGRTIAFELLGDVYGLPMAGGAAPPLATGPPP